MPADVIRNGTRALAGLWLALAPGTAGNRPDSRLGKARYEWSGVIFSYSLCDHRSYKCYCKILFGFGLITSFIFTILIIVIVTRLFLMVKFATDTLKKIEKIHTL